MLTLVIAINGEYIYPVLAVAPKGVAPFITSHKEREDETLSIVRK